MGTTKKIVVVVMCGCLKFVFVVDKMSRFIVFGKIIVVLKYRMDVFVVTEDYSAYGLTAGFIVKGARSGVVL